MNNGVLTFCGYEAGPTGFGFCRELQKLGFACVIIAPSSIAKTAKDKTARIQVVSATVFLKGGRTAILPVLFSYHRKEYTDELYTALP
jgi:transposase